MSKLYQHVTSRSSQHTPRNVNLLYKAEVAAAGLNQKIALLLTKGVGTMICAYLFAVIAVVGFPGFHSTAQAYVQWFRQTFIQLVMLSVIMVGQNVLGRHAELQADEQFNTTQKTYHDIEEIMKHLDAQDAAMLQILQRMEKTL
jgi:ABC-type amino acid transport system permease subunit